MKKNWYTSKTIWINVLALVAVIIQAVTGTDWLNPGVQGVVLAAINIVLRFITKQELDWTKGDDQQ